MGIVIHTNKINARLGNHNVVTVVTCAHTHGLPAGFEGTVVTGGRCGLNTPVGGHKFQKIV